MNLLRSGRARWVWGRLVTAFNVAGYELDVYWAAELRFAVELDVYATHGTRANRSRRTGDGDEDLKLAGVELNRVTGTPSRTRTAPGHGARRSAVWISAENSSARELGQR